MDFSHRYGYWMDVNEIFDAFDKEGLSGECGVSQKLLESETPSRLATQALIL